MRERIGQFEVRRELGRGGMGVVHLAHDPALGRDVAIKTLPADLASDPARLERFEREARTLAGLNHPNIAGIHGLVEQDGATYLVLEYVAGETLADRLSRGPLPVDEAVELAIQIAAGVEAAHEAGIVHRDLKPANIQITPDGQAKVLDLGLARVEDGAFTTGGGLENSPTITLPTPQHSPTIEGAILGTAAYMSPEQARGRRVDKRTDIWSFGVVLYEMLAGASPFHGETATDSIGAVLHKDIDFDRLPATTPPGIRRILDRCLHRDRNLRYRDIGDVRIELMMGDHQAGAMATDPAAPQTPPRTRRLTLLAAAGWLAAAGVGAMLLRPTAPPPDGHPPLALSIAPPRGGIWEVGSNIGWAAISPDGTGVVAKVSTEEGAGLWVRNLSEPGGRLIPGTTEAFYPFWSPDSRRVAYFGEDWLFSVDIDGGLPERIASAPQGRGGSWSDDGRILLSPVGASAVHIVDASGGDEPRPVTRLDEEAGENAHYWPQWLPDGEHFLYMIRTRSQNDQGVYLGRVTDGIDTSRRRIVAAASSAWFVPEREGMPAVLLWVRDGDLLAQPFDWRQGELTGRATVITRGVRVLESQLASMISAADDGTIVHASDQYGRGQLTWFGRDGGSVQPVGKLRGVLNQVKLSPDGTRIALTRVAGGQADIWIHDIDTNESRQVTNIPGYSETPLWSPDSARILFNSDRARSGMVIAADGAGGARPVFESPDEAETDVVGWLPGDWLVYTRPAPGGGPGNLLMTARLDEIEATERLLWDASAINLGAIEFSRNGSFLQSVMILRNSSRLIVRAVDLDADGPRLREGEGLVPIANPVTAAFSHDERELFVAAEGGSVFAIPLERPDGAGVRLGRPEELAVRLRPSGSRRMVPDAAGERLMTSTDPKGPGQSFEILMNWRSRLREE